jgi:transposase InsO family protein
LLAIEDIEHRSTKVRSPRTNGFVERMNRTLLDECLRVVGRQIWYIGIDEIQRDLDQFMTCCNIERSHQGYRLRGRTPVQALREALAIETVPSLDYASPQPTQQVALPDIEIAD